jgi:DNA segregation ATPase FtsK/SpoIIIE-like protein
LNGYLISHCPKKGKLTTLIITLLDGKSPDGLAHLKEGDRVKLVPSDVPTEEKSTINVINERTPNGPVLMDRIFSKSLVERLECTHIGYMYGEISRFKAVNHIELTLSMAFPADYRDYDELDELFKDAARLVVQTQQGSPSLFQRKFEIGYNRAGRIVDQLESKGIVGPFQGARAREILIASEEELEKRLDEIDNET